MNRKVSAIAFFSVVLLAIPLTIAVLKTQQDTRQRAAGITPTPIACAAVPTDTLLLFDNSGSMRDKASTTDTTSKFNAAKTAAATFINTFPDGSPTQLGLVSFASTEVTTSIPVNNQLSTNYTTLKSNITNLQMDSKSGTCIECAIVKANTELNARGRQGIKKVMVLLTDGQANATVTKTYSARPSQQEAEQAALNAAKNAFNQNKVTIYVIGLGADVNASFLQQVASLTGGKYYFPGSSENLLAIYKEIALALSKGSIQGVVYNDLNKNSTLDSGEPGLPGWSVNITNSSGFGGTTTHVTDSTGTYTISNLCDASYVLTQTVQSGWKQTQPASSGLRTATITNGSTVDNINFGNTKAARCSDAVDNDNNGFADDKDSSCHTDGNPNNPNSYDPNKEGEQGGGNTCADSKDNNGNGLIDGADPVCHSDENPNNPGSYNPSLPEITLKPDLVITGMKITLDGNTGSFTCSTGLGVQVTIKNQGKAASAGSFAVKANNTTKTFTGGIQVGTSVNIWIKDYVNGGQNTATVDLNNQINESDETNNQLSSILPVPTTPIECVPTATPTPTPMPPAITFTANPTSIAYNSTSTLTWSSTNAANCTASGAWSGAKAVSGSQSTGNLTTTSTYTLTCTGPGGSTTKSVTITVENAPTLTPTPMPPAITFTGNPTSIAYNGSTLLTWSTTNATSCTASGAWSGTKAATGSQTMDDLKTTSTYTLTCSGAGGTATKSVTITVAAAPTITPTPIPLNTVLSLNVFLHGIGGSGDNANAASSLSTKNPLHKDRKVMVEIFKDTNELLASKETNIKYASASGNFTGTVELGQIIKTGNYTVKIKSSQYLRNEYPGIQILTAGQDINMPAISLVTGDVNNDNKLNILDYNTLYGCYTSDLFPVARSCNDTQKTLADLNDEGHVNMYDLNLFIRELSVQPGL